MPINLGPEFVIDRGKSSWPSGTVSTTLPVRPPTIPKIRGNSVVDVWKG